jgi:hypothetical protein
MKTYIVESTARGCLIRAEIEAKSAAGAMAQFIAAYAHLGASLFNSKIQNATQTYTFESASKYHLVRGEEEARSAIAAKVKFVFRFAHLGASLFNTRSYC